VHSLPQSRGVVQRPTCGALVRLGRSPYHPDVPISPEDARPLSQQIADDLRQRITRGDFAPGERFPSLRALSSEYDVAEMTVQQAFRDLQREGLLVSMSGRGTYVRGDAAVSPQPGDSAAVLDELLAIRAELKELRDRVVAREAGTTEEQVAELTRRVEALERPDGGPDQ
jgi:GntR family transcriptional regulator